MSLFSRFKEAISKSSTKISTSIGSIFNNKPVSEDDLEELEEILITSDLGAKCAADIVDELRKKRFDKTEIQPDFIKQEIATIIADNLVERQKPFELKNNHLNIILFCGVNGNGKTTSIGKLAHYYNKHHNKKVMVAACDTFRAAAVEQLDAWCQRANCQIVKGEEKQDPASVAHIAVEKALAEKVDLLFIDTAGRLHNNTNLMQELQKITKVVEKFGIDGPHHTLLVLDATTGQNAIIQASKFKEIAGIDGIIVTKLDGTAKAGVLVNISATFSLPVYFVGIGEKIEDIEIFDPVEYAKLLIGIREQK